MANHTKECRVFLDMIKEELRGAGITDFAVSQTGKKHMLIAFTIHNGERRNFITGPSGDWRAIRNARSNLRKVIAGERICHHSCS